MLNEVKNNKFAYSIAIIMAMLFFWSMFVKEPKINEITNIQYDTLPPKLDTIKITKYAKAKSLPARIDTFLVHDTVKGLYAELEPTQIINETTKDTVTLSLKYFFPPINSFEDITIFYKEKIIEKTKEIMKTITVTKEPPFYENNWFYVAVVQFVLLIVALI